MAPGLLTVEEVDGRKELTRFVEVPQVLHGEEPCFAPPVMAWERYRVDQRRNSYFEHNDVGLFLARRLGRVVGRIAAHRSPVGEGRFGLWALVNDVEVGDALLDAARRWLSERECTSMRGPVSFEDDDEPGVLVEGFDVPGCTGRPWNPRHEAALLEQLGAVVVEETATWRLPVHEAGPALVAGGVLPGQAALYVDPRLVSLNVAAVPDLSTALRSTGLRQAWALAKRARAADWDDAVVVRCEGDPADVIPALLVSAAQAGYRSVVAPWSPSASAEPETRHRRYRITW